MTRTSSISGPRSIETLCPVSMSRLARRVLAEYGSMFVAGDQAILPRRCIFGTAADVEKFQKDLKIAKVSFGTVAIELQEPAMRALLDAQAEAELMRRRITPLDGSIAGRRSYPDTVRIWTSRFIPALDHWVRREKISKVEADAAKFGSSVDQAEKVMDWEAFGWFFSTNRTKPIFSAVAPPGTSQHLSLLAFDVIEYRDPAVVRILNTHGWFQTIANDAPHFTYLGLKESELPERGLRAVYRGAHKYWVPDIWTQQN